jgi:hypothetical protein
MKAHDIRPSGSVLIQHSPELREKRATENACDCEPTFPVQRFARRRPPSLRILGRALIGGECSSRDAGEELGSNILRLETPDPTSTLPVFAARCAGPCGLVSLFSALGENVRR